MSNLEIIVGTTLIWSLILVSPGPNFIVVSRLSLSNSRHAGIGTSLGIVIGAISYATFTLFGFSIILEKLAEYHGVIRFIGGTYLIWLGINAWVTRKSTNHFTTSTTNSNDFTQGFKTGLLTSLTNPKAIVFFLSLFASLITPTTPFWVKTMVLLIGGTMEFAWYTFVAIILSREKPKRFYDQSRAIIDRVLGTILISFGLTLVLQER